MKKTIPILMLCLVLSFALMGCGRGEEKMTRYTLNPDGTLNKLQWGMTFAQAAQAEKGIAKDNYQTQTQLEQGKDAGRELIVSLPPGELLGIWAQVWMLDTTISSLEMFIFWHVEAIFSRDCRQCPFPPTLYRGPISFWPSRTFTISRLLWMSILTGGIWFLVIVLVVIPPVIIRC